MIKREKQNRNSGTLEAIYIAAERGAPLHQIESVKLVAGRGLEGDRYFDARGSFSKWPGGGRAVSIIAAEAIEAILTEHNIDLSQGRSRRNLVTRDVDLDALVNKYFTIGDALLYGDRLCAPCKYLERLIAPGLYQAIKCRGGLRADVLRDGMIRQGDRLTLVTRPEHTLRDGAPHRF